MLPDDNIRYGRTSSWHLHWGTWFCLTCEGAGKIYSETSLKLIKKMQQLLWLVEELSDNFCVRWRTMQSWFSDLGWLCSDRYADNFKLNSPSAFYFRWETPCLDNWKNVSIFTSCLECCWISHTPSFSLIFFQLFIVLVQVWVSNCNYVF